MVGYSARLSILVIALCFALAVVDMPARIGSMLLRYRWLLTLLATTLLGGHVIAALWLPWIIAWVPIESAPLSQAIAAIAWAALGFAAWRFFQSYRIAILPLQGAMAMAMVLLGLGTALVYPTLIAAISDVAHPEWRASAVGVYRLWRDGGYVAGALLAGAVADLFGLSWAIAAVGLLTFISGLIVLARMYETLAGVDPLD